MAGYDGTQQFYSPDPNLNQQLIQYGRLPFNGQLNDGSHGTTYIDERGNHIIRVVGKDADGNKVVKRYQLINVKNEISVPELTAIEGFDGNDVHLDRLTQELIGPSMFHSTDYNIETIEKTINLLLKNQAIGQDNMNKIIGYFKNFTKEELETISATISKVIADRYYSKDEVDTRVNHLQDQVDNLTNAIRYVPEPNGVFPPGHVGDRDINDKIFDADTKAEIDNMADQFKDIDNQKGDND